MSGALSLRGRNEENIEVVNRGQIKQKFLIRVKELAFFFPLSETGSQGTVFTMEWPATFWL